MLLFNEIYKNFEEKKVEVVFTMDEPADLNNILNALETEEGINTIREAIRNNADVRISIITHQANENLKEEI